MRESRVLFPPIRKNLIIGLLLLAATSGSNGGLGCHAIGVLAVLPLTALALQIGFYNPSISSRERPVIFCIPFG